MLSAITALAVLAVCTSALAGDRRRAEVQLAPAKPALCPAARAESATSAAVLSGLDFTAIAPPGVRLRVIEDEPYVYTFISPGQPPNTAAALGSIALHAALEAGGWYEARVNLRSVPLVAEAELQRSFDVAAESMYQGSMLASELRQETVYSLYEVRSPLGLTDSQDKTNRWREYLGYTAVIKQPLGLQASALPSEDLPEEQLAAAQQTTPYSDVKGELRILRRAGKHCFMLVISVDSGSFPYTLGLTENLARCTINRMLALAGASAGDWLPYLVYYPESEPVQVAPGEALDPRIADLAEQPGDGCGRDAQPITGDVCPQCRGEGVFWPARPYADELNSYKLRLRGLQPVCSHCLMPAADIDQIPAGDKDLPSAIDALTGAGDVIDAKSQLACRQDPCLLKSARRVNSALRSACH